MTWHTEQPSMLELAEAHRDAWRPYGELAPLNLQGRVKFHLTYQREYGFSGIQMPRQRWLARGDDGIHAVDIKITFGEHDVPTNAEVVAVNDIPIRVFPELPNNCSPGKAIGIAYRYGEIYCSPDYLLDCPGAKLRDGYALTKPHKVAPNNSLLRNPKRTAWQGKVCPDCAADRAHYHRHGYLYRR